MKTVRVVTTLRDDEVRSLEDKVPEVEELQGTRQYGKAGLIRAYIRFGMEHHKMFLNWLEAGHNR